MKTPNLPAIQERIRQVRAELARLRVLEKVAIREMQAYGDQRAQPASNRRAVPV